MSLLLLLQTETIEEGTGRAAITLGTMTLAGAGTVSVAGAASFSLGEMTLEGAGTVTGGEPITGLAAVMLGIMTLQARGLSGAEWVIAGTEADEEWQIAD